MPRLFHCTPNCSRTSFKKIWKFLASVICLVSTLSLRASADKFEMAYDVSENLRSLSKRQILSPNRPASLKGLPALGAVKPLFGTVTLAGHLINMAFVREPTGSGFSYTEAVYVDLNLNNDLSDDRRQLVDQPVTINLPTNGATRPYRLALEWRRLERTPNLSLSVESDTNKPIDEWLSVYHCSAYSTVASLGGKLVKLTILDRNGNGVFNDAISTETPTVLTQPIRVELFSQTVVELGFPDMIRIEDLSAQKTDPLNNVLIPLSKYLGITDQVYEIRTSPSGKTVWIEPATKNVGVVRCPYSKTEVELTGKAGSLSLSTDKNSLTLPAGEYNVRRLRVVHNAGDEIWSATVLGGEAQNNPELQIRRQAVGASVVLPRPFMLVVREGQTTELPFALPLKTWVRVREKSAGNRRMPGDTSVSSISYDIGVTDAEGRRVDLNVIAANGKDILVVEPHLAVRENIRTINGAKVVVKDNVGNIVRELKSFPYQTASSLNLDLYTASELRELVSRQLVPLTVELFMNTGPFASQPPTPLKMEVALPAGSDPNLPPYRQTVEVITNGVNITAFSQPFSGRFGR